MRNKQLSIFEREKELKNLIADAERLGFESSLIEKYKSQLLEVQAELQRDKDKKVKFKELERGLITNAN
jgi:hypothetical protein